MQIFYYLPHWNINPGLLDLNPYQVSDNIISGKISQWSRKIAYARETEEIY